MNLVKSFIQQGNYNPTSNDLQNDDMEIIIVSYPPISSKYLILKGQGKFEKLINNKENIEAFILDPFYALTSNFKSNL